MNVYTKVKILHIGPGAQYEGNVFDYWVAVELTNGQVILLFDPHCISLQCKLNEEIEIIISSCFPFHEIETQIPLFKITSLDEINGDFFLSNSFIKIKVYKTDINLDKFIKEDIFSFGRLDFGEVKSII